MQTLIAAIFVFGLLILAHELGHYIVARKTGVKVLELAIGFGPKLFGWRRQGIDYSLRIIPLGGFCRMLGEDPEEAGQENSFPQKPLPVRAVVILAGSVMNLVLAVLVFFVIFFFLLGIPGDEARVGEVVDNSPAEEVGLKAGDRIREIGGESITSWEEVITAISAKPGEELELKIERNDTVLNYRVTPEEEPQTGRGMIGITQSLDRYNFFSSVKFSFYQFGMIFAAIYHTFFGELPLDVAGPVGIVHYIGEAARLGLADLLFLTGLISINLGIINLLPIPALDGGRLLFLIIEAVRGRPIEPEKEGLVHFIGFALLITLILFITYQDILRYVFGSG